MDDQKPPDQPVRWRVWLTALGRLSLVCAGFASALILSMAITVAKIWPGLGKHLIELVGISPKDLGDEGIAAARMGTGGLGLALLSALRPRVREITDPIYTYVQEGQNWLANVAKPSAVMFLTALGLMVLVPAGKEILKEAAPPKPPDVVEQIQKAFSGLQVALSSGAVVGLDAKPLVLADHQAVEVKGTLTLDAASTEILRQVAEVRRDGHQPSAVSTTRLEGLLTAANRSLDKIHSQVEALAPHASARGE